MIDDQIAFVMAERVAGHREEEEVGGTAVLHFCSNHLSYGVVQRMFLLSCLVPRSPVCVSGCLMCILVMSTIPHSQEDEGLSEEERRRMSIEEVRVTSPIRDIPTVVEW